MHRDDLDAEVRSHLAHRADDLERSGLPRAEAERRARLEFGGVEKYKEAVRDTGARGWNASWLTAISRDVTLALRRLRRAPLFAAFALLSLAVGVALPTTVYAILRATLWAEPLIHQPAQLVVVTANSPFTSAAAPRWRSAISLPDIEDFVTTQRTLETTAWSSLQSLVPIGLEGASASAVVVSDRFFDVLGVPPEAGRTIGPNDNRPEAPAVAVVNHRLWRTVLGGNPNIVGSTMHVNGHPFTIVGIMPAAFRELEIGGPSRATIWLPQAAALRLPAGASFANRNFTAFTLFGRMAPGGTVVRAAAEASALAAHLDRETPQSTTVMINGTRLAPGSGARGWSATTYQAILSRSLERVTYAGYVLAAVAGLVLVVACSNLASLSIARGTLRRQEFAVRTALGATRRRLVQDLVAESVLIAAAGLTCSVLLMRALFVWCTIDLPVSSQNVVSIAPVLDSHVIVYAVGAVVLALLTFGVEPAMQVTRAPLRATIAQAGPSVLPGVRRHRTLIRLQVAAAFALLVIAAVAVRYGLWLARDDSGVALDRIALGTADFPREEADVEKRETTEAVLTALRTSPGIDRADAANGMPFGLTVTPRAWLSSPERPAVKEWTVFELASTPGYLGTIGVPIERGRAFDASDTLESQPVAILGAAAARKLFGSTNVVGRTIVTRSAFYAESVVTKRVVVGVAADTDVQSRGSRTSELIHVPLSQAYTRVVTFVARSEDPARATGAIRLAVARVRPNLVVTGAGPGSETLAPGQQIARVAGRATLVLGLTALGLSMVGLHGVLAHLLSARTREMALRLALGAGRRQVWWLSIREGLRPVVSGLLTGLILGVLVRVAANQFGLGIEAFDVALLAVVPGLFLAVAIAACAVPAWRASRVDPSVALRDS